jgi:hypothetical protein
MTLRCKTCRHYELSRWHGGDMKACHHPKLMRQPDEPTGPEKDVPLEVPGPDFGCVLWEADAN